MAKNRINQVEEVAKRVKAGFPSGVDTESHTHLQWLLARIDELEAALTPFARVGATLTANEPPLREVYTEALANAYDMLDKNNSVRPIVTDFGIPA